MQYKKWVMLASIASLLAMERLAPTRRRSTERPYSRRRRINRNPLN
ncbi:MAG: hypothetical protein K0Q94_4426 [Paenibacillus sp.]|jgi:hypothetical protein|nr:hypothetical protein [Paenibacillus sp.]